MCPPDKIPCSGFFLRSVTPPGPVVGGWVPARLPPPPRGGGAGLKRRLTLLVVRMQIQQFFRPSDLTVIFLDFDMGSEIRSFYHPHRPFNFFSTNIQFSPSKFVFFELIFDRSSSSKVIWGTRFFLYFIPYFSPARSGFDGACSDVAARDQACA